MTSQETRQDGSRVELKSGDKVRCLAGSIDKGVGKGAIGIVSGFARLSAYHPREVSVLFSDVKSGWFWLADVELLEASQ